MKIENDKVHLEGGTFYLDDLTKTARRELRLRESNYPRWVGEKKMTKKFADTEIQNLRAILGILESLRPIKQETPLFGDNENICT